MTVLVRSQGKTRFRLWLPLSLLRSKFVLAKLCANFGSSRAVTLSRPDGVITLQLPDGATLTRKQAVAFYNAVRSVVRRCGHFDLVNVQSADGDVVRVRI